MGRTSVEKQINMRDHGKIGVAFAVVIRADQLPTYTSFYPPSNGPKPQKGAHKRNHVTSHSQRGMETDLLCRLPHCLVGLDVGLKEGVEVVRQAVLFRQRCDARLDRPQIVPR